MRRAFKYRVYPTSNQRGKLECTLDLLRDIYNAGLQERRDAWRLNRITISFASQSAQIKDIRISNPEYLSVKCRPIDQCLRQLDKAFRGFFRRVKAKQNPGFPRFKGKGFFNSIIYNRDGFRFRGPKLHISLIGDLKIKLSRPIEGTVKEVRIKREGAKWYAILFCDGDFTNTLSSTGSAIGIDVGIESFATLSDGTQIDNWRFYESTQKKLRIAQRRIARRKKGSGRRCKAVLIVRNIHQRIFNQRRDFQHKLSTHLVAHHDLIAVEKLNIAGLAKGRLSKQITDASWSSFTQMLRYKAESAGRSLVEVSPNFTSQDCSGCGARVKKSLAVRVHSCESCGLSIHRDWNAALNILASGQGVQAST